MTTQAQPDFAPDAEFAPGPARDSRFVIKERWVECQNFPEGHPLRMVEFLHRQMNEEVNGMECAARCLADFPDAEWDLRMCVARQCYDEARHVEMFRRACEQRGGRIGGYPALNFQYRIITRVPDLVGRLAVQNRAFEAEGIDAVEYAIRDAEASGDWDLAALFDAQLADEICHVRFANEYVAKAVSHNPAAAMNVGRALHYATTAFREVMGAHGKDAKYDVNETGRLEAGFTEEEVGSAVRGRATFAARQ